MPKPRIGITFGRKTPDDDVERYSRAVEEAGGDPVVLRPGADDLALDGLLLSGGADIDPALYGQDRDPRVTRVDTERDAFEIPLLKSAMIRDLPVLAICRGFQLLNIVCDGSLVQHMDGHRAERGASASHDITVTHGTKLAEALGASGIVHVNSRHHQAVREVERAATLVVSAISPDGYIEGLESPHHRWVVGVQCHPERQDEVDSRFTGLFRAFVQQAAQQGSE